MVLKWVLYCKNFKNRKNEEIFYKNWRFNLEFDPTITKIIEQISISNKIKKLLLDVLNCEDDYIEVSKVIKHFATLTSPVLYSYCLLVFSCVSVIYYIVSLFSLISCII